MRNFICEMSGSHCKQSKCTRQFCHLDVLADVRSTEERNKEAMVLAELDDLLHATRQIVAREAYKIAALRNGKHPNPSPHALENAMNKPQVIEEAEFRLNDPSGTRWRNYPKLRG